MEVPYVVTSLVVTLGRHASAEVRPLPARNNTSSPGRPPATCPDERPARPDGLPSRHCCLFNLNIIRSHVFKPLFENSISWDTWQAKLPDTSRFSHQEKGTDQSRFPTPCLQVMAVCHPKAWWDRGGHGEEIKRNPFFVIILEELYRSVTLTAVLSPPWECGTFSPPTRRAVCLYLQRAREATRATDGNELAVITEVAAPITVYLTAVLSRLTPSCRRWESETSSHSHCSNLH